MLYRLFLDDWRDPKDCLNYMANRANELFIEYYADWVVVRSFDEFKQTIEENGLPMLISFDHDLDPGGIAPDAVDEYETLGTKNTGWHCAYWLVNEYLKKTGQKKPLCIIHSVNKVGTKHILDLLK